MHYTIRQAIYVAIFGALWGGIEITLGSLLHVLNVPQSGALLAAIGIVILVVGRSVVPRRGSVFLMGVVAAVLKLFSLGGIVLNPMLGIVMEALLVELGLWWGPLTRWRCMTAGTLGAVWNILHPFLTQGLLAGRGMLFAYRLLIEGGARLFGWPERLGWAIVAALLVGTLVLGALAGLIGWQVADLVRRRRQWDAGGMG